MIILPKTTRLQQIYDTLYTPNIEIDQNINYSDRISDLLMQPKYIELEEDQGVLYSAIKYSESMLKKYIELEDAPLIQTWTDINKQFDNRLCTISEEYEISTYLIKTKMAGFIPFRMYVQQRYIYQQIKRMDELDIPVRIICLKPRQFGGSTLFTALTYRKHKRLEGSNAFVVAHVDKSASNLLNMISNYHRFDRHSRPASISQKKLSYTDTYGGELLVASGFADNDGRSWTAQFLHLSEVAFWKNAENFASLMECVPYLPKTAIFIESTPNGLEDFYTLYNSKLDDGYERIFVPWYKHDAPEYKLEFRSIEDRKKFESSMTESEKLLWDRYNVSKEQLNWRRKKIYGHPFLGDEELFGQEYPVDDVSCFLGSGRIFFNVGLQEHVEYVESTANKKITKYTVSSLKEDTPRDWKDVSVPDPYGPLSIWEYPMKGASYVIGADIAEGKDAWRGKKQTEVNADYSVISVLKRSVPLVQVAEFRSRKFSPDETARIIKHISTYYNNAWAAVERNNTGHTTITILRSIYKYVFRMPRDIMSEAALKILSGSHSVNSTYGWITSQTTRQIMLDELKSRIRDTTQLVLSSQDLINETYQFITDKNGKPIARDGHHDDTIFALAIALQCHIWSPNSMNEHSNIFEDESSKLNFLMDAFRTISDIPGTQTPFGLISGSGKTQFTHPLDYLEE